MRIANIIITHKNPNQLERLVKKMQHDKFDFFIHVDKKVDIRQYEHLRNITGVYFIQNRVACNWGGYSTLKAMMNSLNEVLQSGTEYLYYNLLSGQDYPLKSSDIMYSFFVENSEKSFIFYEDENSEWWKNAVLRFQKYHLTDYNFVGKFMLEKIVNAVLPTRKFPLPLKLYGGSKSSWWTINKVSAVYLSDFFARENMLEKFLKYCWGTDEFVIPTILLNSPHKETIVNDNLRYIDFTSGLANPKILVSEDFNDLINSNMFFARKFDVDVNTAILDRIDECFN